jgi:hypothetical protein
MLRPITVNDVHGKPRLGYYEDTPSKQQLENMYRARCYFRAVGSLPPDADEATKKLLSDATALAVDYRSLERYCEKEGIQ